jgi:pimeloyl-ACP methyl ester carboxylesterase
VGYLKDGSEQREALGDQVRLVRLRAVVLRHFCRGLLPSDRVARRPGRLVSAGELRLNLYCIGQAGPTVVLEAGLADSLDAWRRVQPDIARFARVCSYDRAGYGYSDPGPIPRTSGLSPSHRYHAGMRLLRSEYFQRNGLAAFW